MINQQEIWQVEVQGQIYEANIEELTQWIAEGALQPEDKVRRGNLRWLEAQKIPVLYGFFNAKALGVAPPVLTSIATATETKENLQAQTANFATTQTVSESQSTQQFTAPIQETVAVPEKVTNTFQEEAQVFIAPTHSKASQAPSNVCFNHPKEEPIFVCGTCSNIFCKDCPKSYGGTVRICPMCGAMCKPIADFQSKNQRAARYSYDVTKGFGVADFGKALIYPFKYKFSLISGAILYMFFSLGQSAAGLGGMYLVAAAIFCAMMANALIFGCLANTVDNMAQGKLDDNFMPSFDDFNLWDDVVHPFFLSIGTYLSSFGLLIVIMLGMVWYSWHSFSDQSATSQQQASVKDIKELVNSAPKQPRFENGKVIMDDQGMTPEQRQAMQDGDIQKVQELIQQQRQGQLESVMGKAPETQEKEQQQAIQNLLKVGIPFIVVGFLASLWGLFYFPAACAVAGYTRSFRSTLNPLVGLDTIKRMGFDYVKILGMCFIVAVVSGFISLFLNAILSPFNMPGMGNIPAKMIGSLFSFYFSIVFAVILGYALYKNSSKLDLYRG